MLDLFAMLKKGHCEGTKVRIGRLQNLISSSCIGTFKKSTDSVCTRSNSKNLTLHFEFVMYYRTFGLYEHDRLLGSGHQSLHTGCARVQRLPESYWRPQSCCLQRAGTMLRCRLKLKLYLGFERYKSGTGIYKLFTLLNRTGTQNRLGSSWTPIAALKDSTPKVKYSVSFRKMRVTVSWLTDKQYMTISYELIDNQGFCDFGQLFDIAAAYCFSLSVIGTWNH